MTDPTSLQALLGSSSIDEDKESLVAIKMAPGYPSGEASHAVPLPRGHTVARHGQGWTGSASGSEENTAKKSGVILSVVPSISRAGL